MCWGAAKKLLTRYPQRLVETAVSMGSHVVTSLTSHVREHGRTWPVVVEQSRLSTHRDRVNSRTHPTSQTSTQLSAAVPASVMWHGGRYIGCYGSEEKDTNSNSHSPDVHVYTNWVNLLIGRGLRLVRCFMCKTDSRNEGSTDSWKFHVFSLECCSVMQYNN